MGSRDMQRAIAVNIGDIMNLKSGENKVFYDSDGKKLSGLLYLPGGEGNFPAMVITRPASGVKEQTIGLYAKKLSEQGFVTIAFDSKGLVKEW